VVVEAGDTAATLQPGLGFELFTNPIDGTRFGDPRFSPIVDIAEEHGSFYELVFILHDDGAGVVLLVPKLSATHPDLLAFCAAFATQPT
jgi:hypothetical protein